MQPAGALTTLKILFDLAGVMCSFFGCLNIWKDKSRTTSSSILIHTFSLFSRRLHASLSDNEKGKKSSVHVCVWLLLALSCVFSLVLFSSAGHWSELRVCGRNKSNASTQYRYRRTPLTAIIIQGNKKVCGLWGLRLHLLLRAEWMNVWNSNALLSFYPPLFFFIFLHASFFLLFGCKHQGRLYAFHCFASGQVNISVLFKGDIFYKGQEGKRRKIPSLRLTDFCRPTCW